MATSSTGPTPECPRSAADQAAEAEEKALTRRAAPLGRGGLAAQSLGEHSAVGGIGLVLGLAAGVGDAGKDPASVVIADRPADVPGLLEPLDQAGEGALAEVNLVGELLDSAMALGVVRQTAEHFVLAEGETVLALEGTLKRFPYAGVSRLELTPLIQKVIGRHLPDFSLSP
jgi:hypothetical protein